MLENRLIHKLFYFYI